MKSLALLAGLLVAVSAHAALSSRANLIGQRLNRSVAGESLLICRYTNASTKFEILSQSGKCAPYITIQ